jgi:phenylalanyl-tRNA synthetase beta chain
MDHAVALLLAVAGGRVADTPVLVADAPPAPIEVRLRTARVRQVIGVSVSAAESARLLAEVGFHAVQEGDVLRVTVPPFRTDVEHEIDLVEEVARLYGYDRIPGALQAFRVGTVADDRLGGVESRLRDALVGLGFLELRSMPFVASAPSNAVRVVNPLVQTEAYLRGTLLDTLGRRAEFNLTHAGEGNLRLFEIGTVFAADQTSSPPSGVVRPREEVRLAALAMGARRPPHFTEPAPPMWDEWDAKGLGEIVAQAAYPGSVVELRPSSGPATEVSAGAQRRLWEICVDGTSVGEIARVGLDRPAWAADAFGVEVRLEQVASADVAGPGQRVADGDAQREGPPDGGAAGVARYTPIPPLPASWLDMTLVLPDGMPAAEVERVVLGARDPLLERLELVDEFRGGTVPDGHRSVTWRLTFRDSLRTLVEKQVEARRDKLLRALETELGVRQRTI